MNYELAKQLKDAGFPQRTGLCSLCFIDSEENIIVNYPIPEEKEVVYIPSLSNLIEACGKLSKDFPWGEDKFDFTLEYWSKLDEWIAGYQEPNYHEHLEDRGIGKTPEEAIAKLWLELNK